MVPAPKSPLSAFIFDLGDVLFTWSSNTTTNISSKFLRSILSSPTWFDYECGRISREACYQKVANEFSLKASQVAEAFGQAHDSLKPDESIVALLRSLKSGGKFKIFAMSNVGKEDFAALADRMDWSLFDDVFISGKAGMRKPDKEFFRYVLTKIEFAPEQVVFIDDKQENVRAAEELGINGVVFDESTVQHLKGFIDDPVSRGMAYLRRNARQFDSVTDTGVSVPDNFANLLILEVTQDP